MPQKSFVAVLAAAAMTAAALLTTASHGLARDRAPAATDFSAQQQKKKQGPARKVTPRTGTQRVAPRRATPRVVAPRKAAPRKAAPRQVAPRQATPRRGAPSSVAPRTAAPKTPRRFTPTGARARSVTARKLRGVPTRGAGRAFIRGQNYSAWRAGYRVRRGDAWRTFVALSVLGAIAIGTREFYPYAYISAPEPYCDGLTEDGCQLVWQEVETVEGDIIPQCVAYCPWQ
jgi:hypothetical protein